MANANAARTTIWEGEHLRLVFVAGSTGWSSVGHQSYSPARAELFHKDENRYWSGGNYREARYWIGAKLGVKLSGNEIDRPSNIRYTKKFEAECIEIAKKADALWPEAIAAVLAVEAAQSATQEAISAKRDEERKRAEEINSRLRALGLTRADGEAPPPAMLVPIDTMEILLALART